ncbi:MAG: CDP-alcohol phosphatidyltransferase family protein [Hyphomicrobiaceae bacterium]
MLSLRQRQTFWLLLVNAITAFRLVAAPFMLMLAFMGERHAFLYVLVAAFASDAADGALARLTKQDTGFGALFDTFADAIAYCTIAVSVAILWPELIHAEMIAYTILIASFVLPGLLGLMKFRQLTSYHTILTKIAVVTTAVGLLVLLTGGPSWPIRLAASVAALAAVEEVAITLVSDTPRSNINGLFSLWRGRG